mgnify:CR=1 FL=1
MEYTVYTSDGHWLGLVDCTNAADVPVLIDGQQVVSGNQGEGTMLANGVVSDASGAALTEYNNKLMSECRSTRDLLLTKSDWTQSNDSPLTDAKKQEWATYRQALRDLPANTTDPEIPAWPTQPS